MADLNAEPTNLGPETLSNTVLDDLYAIRRIFVGRYNVFSVMRDRVFEADYYKRKTESLDAAIGAYIEVNNVPINQTEKLVPVGNMRIPGSII